MTTCARARRRGAVVMLVLWAIAIAALTTGALQLIAYRQASVSRETLQRIQARWAARAGLEYTIAVMADHTQNPVPEDAFAMMRDMEHVAQGSLYHSRYNILHYSGEQPFWGPADEHARMNINTAVNQGLLFVFDDMTFDINDSARDFIDEDDDISTFGVERDWYLSQPTPFEPRNGFLRTTAEFELIAGVWPREFRGEDWNLNNRLDPNENDGSRTWPDYDEPDDLLDAGWSGWLTAYSTAGGPTPSGLPRIHLRYALPEDLEERLGLDLDQATVLILFGRNESNTLPMLLSTPLANIDASGAAGTSPVNPQIPPLTTEQLRAVLAETMIEDPLDRAPGKMNINTIPADLLRRIFDLLGLDVTLADEVLYLRETQAEGITSILDLYLIEELGQQDVQRLAELFDVVANVYTVSSVGRSDANGLEVEIIAVVDRSTVPIRIIEYREQ